MVQNDDECENHFEDNGVKNHRDISERGPVVNFGLEEQSNPLDTAGVEKPGEKGRSV